MANNPERHTCLDCGYVWTYGMPGNHNCVPLLKAKIERLENQLWQIQRWTKQFHKNVQTLWVTKGLIREEVEAHYEVLLGGVMAVSPTLYGHAMGVIAANVGVAPDDAEFRAMIKDIEASRPCDLD